jgi:hypothetical protein
MCIVAAAMATIVGVENTGGGSVGSSVSIGCGGGGCGGSRGSSGSSGGSGSGSSLVLARSITTLYTVQMRSLPL